MQSLKRAMEEAVQNLANQEQQLQALQLDQGQLEKQQRDMCLSELQCEAAELQQSLEVQRRKNNELREKNWAAMEALSATESLLLGKLDRTTKVWEEKLRESEEAQRVLLKNCDTYKKEGILQRLQSSVEQEEMRWRVKLEVSQREQRELSLKVVAVERERDELMAACGELENVRLDKQHLASELEKAKREGATYVAEVNKLQAQLNLALCRLEAGENQRQKVAGDLSKAQRSLDLIQVEIQEEAPAADLIENSHSLTQRDGVEERRKEKMAAGLYQTVRELQQLLLALNKQLTTGQEGVMETVVQQLRFRNLLAPPTTSTHPTLPALLPIPPRPPGRPPAPKATIQTPSLPVCLEGDLQRHGVLTMETVKEILEEWCAQAYHADILWFSKLTNYSDFLQPPF
ncbi:hypothetical protein JZ751_009424 [Albula glossodonta]|uniref:Uncharacterized protein n=1 Tax=Albula glossodonta TaxID=121402 RepID=A0A8T2N1D1_9TELE|nr:hypothetical protein JZ751_009424 [Albula glossodonta]